MKIVMAARWPVGGIKTFLQYVYSQSTFHDCAISLVAHDADLPAYILSKVPESRIKVITCGPSSRDLAMKVRAIMRHDGFDILHTHGLTTAVLGQVTRIGMGLPHVTTVHDVFLPGTFAGVNGFLKQRALGAAISGIDAVHAVGIDCAENFLEYMPSVKADKVHPILNGVDTARFSRALPIDAHHELGLRRDTRLVGFFGRFMAQKGFRTLVDAIEIITARSDAPKMRVVTFGWGGFIREDYAYLRDKGLEDSFVQMPQTDIPEVWMKAMDVIAIPSRWEACPLLPMEALVAGVPIIGSDCVGLREVLAGTPAKSFEANDAEALARLLIEELLLPRVDEFIGYKPEAIQRFDVASTARRIRGLYDLVCAK